MLLLTAPAVFAQAQPAYSGTSSVVGGSSSNQEWDNGTGDWNISGPNNFYASNTSKNGWDLGSTTNTSATVIIPATAASGQYTLSIGGKFVKSVGNGDTGYNVYSVFTAVFQVVPAPPTKPAPGSPAFSWQGSVGGVNTGNGNKTTTVPITGWTQRGGMAVSCALYHNSQGGVYGPWGNKWVPSYFTYISLDGSGNPTLHWDNGLSYAFLKNGSAYTPPYGILDTLVSTGSSTFTLTTPGGVVYTFGYAPGNVYLSKITDLDGNALVINHNTDTTVSTVVDTAGRTLTYTYVGGHLSAVSDPLGRSWGFTYGAAGGSGTNNLWYITLPTLNGSSYALWFGYDAASDITAMQTPGGHAGNHTSTFGYNSNSSVAWARDPLGSQTSFTYNANNTVITDPNGHTLTHTYQASRLSGVTDAQGLAESYVYDYNNILTQKTDKRGHVWTFNSHFSNAGTSTDTDALGNATTTTYDTFSMPLVTTDPVGNKTTNGYSTDGKDDLLSVQVTGTGGSPFTATSHVSSYSNGLPTTFADAYGKSSSVTYDTNGTGGCGCVLSATDASSIKTSATYNVLGWTLTSTDALNHTTTSTYDAWGRVTSVTAPDNTTTKTTYDLDGDLLTATDADNHTVTNVYDGDDRLVQTTNGRGDVVTYTYDGPSGYGTQDVNHQTQYGLLSKKTDGNGHVTTYTYTARSEPYQTFYADGKSESIGTTATNGYDASGNVLMRVKADGNAITYTYDADNRLTGITYPSGPQHLHVTTFSYDADGRKTLMTDGIGSTAWTYADGLHLTQTVTPYGTVAAPNSTTQTVGYAYDLDGRRSIMSLVGIGSWNYAYYPNGQLYTVINPYNEKTTYVYDGAGRMTQQTNGDGTIRTQAFDAASQITDLYDYTSMSAVAHFQYAYSPAGEITCMTQNGSATTSYTYDGSDQLLTEVHAGDSVAYSLAFTYDHNGNRLTQTSGGQPYQSFTYDAHDKLLSGNNNGEVYGYDANGNQTGLSYYGSSYAFTFDDEDRLTGVTGPNGLNDTFAYNGLGQRVAKTDSTGTYALVSDGASPAADVLADGAAVYTPGLSSRKGSSSEFRHGDLLGSLRFLTDANQNVVANRLFSAFGSTVASSGDPSTPFGWVGDGESQMDADTGLVLMGHRLYDSRLGRFISQDPAGEGTNWYAYCRNNPVNETDPSGLLPASVDDIGIGLPNLAAAPGSPYDYSQSFTLIGVYQIMKDKDGNPDPSKAPKFLFNMLEPNGVDYAQNAREWVSFMHSLSRNYFANRSYAVRNSMAGVHYYQEVHTGGPMDYKQLRKKPGISYLFSSGTGMTTALDNFGNFNAGAYAASLGLSLDTAIGGADLAHRFDNLTIQPDNPAGQLSEKAGWNWYVTNYGFH